MNIRLVKEHELKQAATLAEDVFCNEEDRYMESSFPTLFRPGTSHSYGAFDEQGKLVSFMGMVPLIIQSQNSTLLAYSIGAVCTDPDYRGQGLAGKLLVSCKQHAKDAGASLMFISGERSLYSRAGSVHFGKSTKYVIHSDMTDKLTEEPQQWKLREMEPTDIFAVHALLVNQSAAIQWGITDLQQFLDARPMANIQHHDQVVLVAESPSRQIDAFVVLAIPKAGNHDVAQEGTVVEWVGTPAAVTALLSHSILQFKLSSLSLMVTWNHTELLERLELISVKPSTYEENAGTVLIVDGGVLISQAGLDSMGHKEATLGVLPDGNYVLNTLRGTTLINGDAELCSLLFDPDSPIKQHGSTVVVTLPLPYMYGLYFI
jgi:predicted N-acetyltransferase YhbS